VVSTFIYFFNPEVEGESPRVIAEFYVASAPEEKRNIKQD
jgi:hypothetical protein